MVGMTGAEFMAEVEAYAAEHPDAFEGLEVLIEEAVEEVRLLPVVCGARMGGAVACAMPLPCARHPREPAS